MRGGGSRGQKIDSYFFAQQKADISCHQMQFLERQNALKCVFGQGSVPDPAGVAHSAPTIPTRCTESLIVREKKRTEGLKGKRIGGAGKKESSVKG